MELINVFGQVLSISASAWSAALEIASGNGWQPRGTRQPPLTLEGLGAGEWEGRYTPGVGQEVTRLDAMQFARSLQSERELPPVLAQLADFAGLSGFLIRGGGETELGSLMNLLYRTADQANASAPASKRAAS